MMRFGPAAETDVGIKFKFKFEIHGGAEAELGLDWPSGGSGATTHSTSFLQLGLILQHPTAQPIHSSYHRSTYHGPSADVKTSQPQVPRPRLRSVDRQCHRLLDGIPSRLVGRAGSCPGEIERALHKRPSSSLYRHRIVLACSHPPVQLCGQQRCPSQWIRHLSAFCQVPRRRRLAGSKVHG